MEGISKALLIPMPSSKPKTSPNYWPKPSPRWPLRRKNRDDRHKVFCELLASKNSNIVCFDVLERTVEKPEKVHWTAEQHAQSMSCSPLIKSHLLSVEYFILIDDVTTRGGTLGGAKLVLLNNRVPEERIITTAIGRTSWELL